MTGKTQNEAVAILRNAPFGSKVKIVVSRQVDDIIDQEKVSLDYNCHVFLNNFNK